MSKDSYTEFELLASKKFMETQEAQIGEHDCKNYSVFNNTSEYIKNECFKCNRILKFQWKSVVKRIISVFIY